MLVVGASWGIWEPIVTIKGAHDLREWETDGIDANYRYIYGKWAQFYTLGPRKYAPKALSRCGIRRRPGRH